MPQLNRSTNSRSSAILSPAESPRKHSGATELPAARSRHAKKLYKNVASSPAKMITRYSRICPYSSCGICRKRKIASRNA